MVVLEVVSFWEFEVGPSEGWGGSAVTKFLVRTSFFSGGSGTTPSCTTPRRARARARAKRNRNRNRNRNRGGRFIG